VTYAVSMHVPGLTEPRYSALVRELVDRGLWPPAARLSHVPQVSQAGVDITEVWESSRAYNQFVARIFAVLDREDLRVLTRHSPPSQPPPATAPAVG
jgi:hypothetical protein